ncbi:MAG: hypothetical protein H6R01_1511 [Burkholderiaceae bacterium]|nr:hypothetical protein [Burkholderiaceae bacterium]
MHAYKVTVRTAQHQITYTAIGPTSADVSIAAIDAHGICAVSVHPIGG